MGFRNTLLLLAAVTLSAQEPLPYLAGQGATSQGWEVTLGARLMDNSSYLGSDTRRTTLMPIFSAEYARRFYLGASRVGPGFGGGVHLLRDGDFTWDLGLGVGDRRPESRSPLLAGMGDRRADISAGTGLHYRHAGYHAGLTLSEGLRDAAGTRATLTLEKAIPLAERWHLSMGLNGTWASASAMAYDFGITPAQAANRAALVASGDTDRKSVV